MGELLNMLFGEDAYRVQVESLLQAIAHPHRPAAAMPALAPITRQAPNSALPEPSIPLSSRELEVLTLVAQGLTNHEIAHRLVLSPSTVRNHTVNIFDKLHVRTRRAAAQQARQLGLIT